MLEGVNIGFALCASFCTFKSVIPQISKLKNMGANIIPVMSENAYTIDSRFGSAESFNEEIEQICGNKIIHTIKDAEPFGPKALLDILVIAPCTGNTLAKLAAGIADTSVTLAAKAHLRNSRPVVVAVSSNDALGANAKNIGLLLNSKNIYFVPMKQDDPDNKPRSIVAKMDTISDTIEYALSGNQIQPIFI